MTTILAKTSETQTFELPSNVTFDKALDWLVSQDLDSTTWVGMVNEFVTSYSIVRTAEQFFQTLTQWWSSSKKLRPRLLVVLCSWLETHYETDFSDRKLNDQLFDFIEKLDPSQGNRLKLFLIRGATAGRLRMLARKKYDQLAKKTSSKGKLDTRLAATIQEFKGSSVDKMSAALLYLENLMYQNTSSWELVGQNWQKPEVARHLLKRAIDQFNTVSYWVTSVVCSTPAMADRVSCIEKFIALCENCEKDRNYNGLMEILSGLNHTSSQRMKKTWAQVSVDARKRKSRLDRLMINEKNFRHYRIRLRQHQAKGEACVPYMAVHLRDLISLATGTDDFTDKSKKYINFNKVLVMGRLVGSIKALGEGQVTLAAPTGKAVIFWLDLCFYDEDGLYEHSTLSEPLAFEQEELASYITNSSNYENTSESNLDSEVTEDASVSVSEDDNRPAPLARGVDTATVKPPRSERMSSKSSEAGRLAVPTQRRPRQPQYKPRRADPTQPEFAQAMKSFLNVFEDSDSDSD